MVATNEGGPVSDGRTPDFHVSMTNFMLGKNPVILAEKDEDSDQSPGESSAEVSREVSEETCSSDSGAASDESSGPDSTEAKVIIIPVEASSGETSDASDIKCEKQRVKESPQLEGNDSSDDASIIICEKKKKKKKHLHDNSDTHKSESPSQENLDSKSQSKKMKKNKAKQSGSQSDESTTEETSNSTPEQGDDSTTDNSASEAASAGVSSEAHTEGTEDDSSDWSISEDALLRGMKEGGESWAEIAKAMQRSKHDVKSRWKVVEKQPKPDDSNDDDEGEGNGGEKQTKSEQKPKKGSGKAKAQKTTTEDYSTAEDSKDKKDGKDKGASKKQDRNKKKGKPLSITDSSSDDLSTDSTPNEDLEQQAYLHTNIHSALYPKRITLEPDAAFTPTDCEVLASVDAQRHAGRWLEMQANFFNATGRWIPLHCIRRKIQHAETENLKDAMAKNGEKEELVEKVMTWINGVDG